jgi:UDP-N-acetylglucosamine--N-acetylmuramyl-(pentapeptide) pyrophosphoryl-undecaprenol N-acetylglucosamine transferase
MAQQTKRILFTGGGSGGHVYPLIAIIEALQQLAVDNNILAELYYLGTKDAFTPLFEKVGCNVQTISGAKMRRYVSASNVADIPRFVWSLVQAFFKMWAIMPDAICSKGGTGALPVVIAGWFYRIPILVHDSDMTPGITNAISSRFASRVAVSFKDAEQYFNPSITQWTGHPMRLSFTPGTVPRERAKQALGFTADEPLMVVLGGSQGAQRVNEVIVAALHELLQLGQILHQTGPANYQDVVSLAHAATIDLPAAIIAKHKYQAVPYIEDMGTVLAAADLVITRAGSSSIFELAAYGKPAILIPIFESANDHQRMNAESFAHTGGGVVIEENNLFPSLLVKQARLILGDPVLRQKMEAASAAFAKHDAAQAIAAELLRIA